MLRPADYSSLVVYKIRVPTTVVRLIAAHMFLSQLASLQRNRVHPRCFSVRLQVFPSCATGSPGRRLVNVSNHLHMVENQLVIKRDTVLPCSLCSLQIDGQVFVVFSY